MNHLMKKVEPSAKPGARLLRALLSAALLLPAIAFSQNFPDKPLRLIVPFTTGAATDTVARLVAIRMGEALGQQVIVENKVGAGGTIGMAELARSAPDGYSLFFQTVTTAAMNMHLYKKLPFDPIGDFQPVAQIAQVPNVLIIDNKVPAKDLQEFIGYLKANPGKFSYGTAGNGTIMHFLSEVFKKTTGTQVQHIPYKGSLPAMQDLMAGQLVMMFDNAPGPIGFIKGNRVHALAVTSATRVPALPNVPTMAEAGLPEFKGSSWFAIYARAGVPAPVLAKLEAAALKAINHPDTVARLRDLGAIPQSMGVAELDKHWKSEIEYWRPIIQSANLSLD
jgi:tripartite-type tricarboxylate transporter receptor subunit TctC